MSSSSPALAARLATLSATLPDLPHAAVAEALTAAEGNLATALPSLHEHLAPASLQKLELVNALADWSGDHLPLVNALAGHESVRDLALNLNAAKLNELLLPENLPPDAIGATLADKQANFARSLSNQLFVAQPSAVLQRLLQDKELPLPGDAPHSAVASFLNNQPDFNIRTTSIYTALAAPDAFKGIASEEVASVTTHLKTLQRVQALTNEVHAIAPLLAANHTSALRISEIPESHFLATHSASMGESTARNVYTNALNVHIRNEHALMSMREAVRGSGLAIIDGAGDAESRLILASAALNRHAPPLDFNRLFNVDQCACDDCLSVYSPASYFVELLQYLRNNNLDPLYPNTGKTGIANTALEKLFRRRPDLGCLELTCENTFTVLPYIDLALEVMESFVVHQEQFHNDANTPKQLKLDVFNVMGETTSELLAQPQHVNYQAYCLLKDAPYPFTLPYHQAVDVARIWLEYFGSSRAEILDVFRSANESNTTLPPAKLQELQAACASATARL
jgi:hypothetical protein